MQGICFILIWNFRQCTVALLESNACTLHMPNRLQLCWRDDKHTGKNAVQHVVTICPFPIQQLQVGRLTGAERGSLQYRFQHLWEPDGLHRKKNQRRPQISLPEEIFLLLFIIVPFLLRICHAIVTEDRNEPEPPLFWCRIIPCVFANLCVA